MTNTVDNSAADQSAATGNQTASQHNANTQNISTTYDPATIEAHWYDQW